MSTVIQPRSRTDSLGNQQSEYDAATSEMVQCNSAAYFEDDFTGAGHASIPAYGSPVAGYAWAYKVGTGGTVSPVSNFSGGAMSCTIPATSEQAEATLACNDVLNWDMTKSAIFEALVVFQTLPTSGTEIVAGLRSAWASGGPDNNAYYADFQLSGSGAINYRTKDGINTLANSSGVTVTAGQSVYLRIDATNPLNVRFFINGAEVSSVGQMSFQATGASAVLQPMFSVYKASGTSVGTLYVDKAMIGMNRS